MFTGLIESMGQVAAVERVASGQRLVIETSLASDLSIGESIAVNGVCLTVVAQSGATFAVDVSPETLRVTTLGGWTTHRPVNLERALRAGDRLGGHFVLGHVDAVTSLESARADGECHWLQFELSEGLQPYLISKGSVCVDGISLTVASLDEHSFGVQIVPHTLAQTSLGVLTPGAGVNIEVDVLGKYVARMMELQVVPTQESARRFE
ncbi:MAG: riboflavin synthase [Acidobacteria bacterium]|nr:riboflavin synthase [Acidobacteriota bacterium]